MINDGTGIPYYLSGLDKKRTRCGLISYMLKNNYPISISSTHDDSDTFFKKVSDFASSLLHKNNPSLNTLGQKLSEDFIKNLISQVEGDLIPLSYFDWLKDDRACYYTWLNIQSYFIADPNSNNTFYPYIDMGLPTVTSSAKERFGCIVTFIDLLLTSKNDKVQYLEYIKNNFSNTLELHPFKGLNKKDIEQCQWYYGYITDYYKKSSQLAAHNKINVLALNIKPTSDEEIYHLIYALYDTWPSLFGDKKEFERKLSKAYSQRKFREKNKNKQPLNTYLTKETKAKLEALRTHYNNKTLHDTLDLIIRQSYEQTIKNRSSG